MWLDVCFSARLENRGSLGCFLGLVMVRVGRKWFAARWRVGDDLDGGVWGRGLKRMNPREGTETCSTHCLKSQ